MSNTEGFITILKNIIYKYITSIKKNVHIDKSNDIVDKHNNIYHRTIKMKPVDIKKKNTYINSSIETIDQNPKFKIGDIVRVSNYKKSFSIGWVPNWSEGVFVINNVISNLKDEGSVGTFDIKEL